MNIIYLKNQKYSKNCVIFECVSIINLLFNILYEFQYKCMYSYIILLHNISLYLLKQPPNVENCLHLLSQKLYL